MARVDNIIFCLKAVNLGEGGVCANTILSAITPEYIPGLYSFSVIVSILDIDESVEHCFTVRFCDSNNEEVVGICNQTLPKQNNFTGNLPRAYRGVNIAMEWNNVNFRLSGEYKIEIELDNCLIGSKTIYVKGKNENE